IRRSTHRWRRGPLPAVLRACRGKGWPGPAQRRWRRIPSSERTPCRPFEKYRLGATWAGHSGNVLYLSSSKSRVEKNGSADLLPKIATISPRGIETETKSVYDIRKTDLFWRHFEQSRLFERNNFGDESCEARMEAS